MAPWDTTTKIMTISIFILLCTTSLYIALCSGLDDLLLVLVIILLSWVSVPTIYLFAPSKYILFSDKIVIQRPISPIVILVKNVKLIKLDKKVKPGIRLAATGGLFGWFGLFTLKNGEKVKVYATRWDLMIRIETHTEIFLISPDKPEIFYKTLQEYIQNVGNHK
jgi:hypothetical protein